MAFFTEQQKAKIIEVLTQRGVTLPCPRCANTQFSLLDGIVLNSLGNGKTVTLGGESIPTAVGVCVRCGMLFLHALGPLGVVEELGIKP